MARTIEDFLNDCTDCELATFELLLVPLNQLRERLVDSGRVSAMWFDFDQERGFSLLFRHPKLLQNTNASIIWGFPNNVAALYRRSSLCTRTYDLAAAWVPHAIIDAFGADLVLAGFHRRRDWKDWRTHTAGEKHGICTLYQNDAPKRAALLTAVEQLVDRINALPGDAPEPAGPYEPAMPKAKSVWERVRERHPGV